MTGKQCFKSLQRGMTLLELSVVLLVLIALAGLTVPYVGGIGSTAMCQTTDATMQAVKEAIMGGAAGAGFYGDTLDYYPKATKSTTTDYNLTFLFSAPTDNSWGGMDSFNAKTAVGWHGPYLQSGGAAIPAGLGTSFVDVFDAATNPTGKVHLAINAGSQVMDAWHRPIILQVPYYDDDGAGPHSADYHPEYARLVSAGPGTGIEPGDAAIDTSIQTQDASDRGDDRVLFLKTPDPLAGGNTPCDVS
ncbi:MAG: prepilin-type N-terminal cleavage/methylation domain-containing protein [Methylobacter sp.]|jgi:prepilin-type N-terminal cleavage/methylation domain-containing protein